MSEGRGVVREIAFKLAALFSFCGGPLYVSDLLKPQLGSLPAFLITFVPVGLMLMGSFFLDDVRSRLSMVFVQGGRLGLYLALGMHLYALWRFAQGARVAEIWLYYFGIAVGALWSFFYLRAAHRWESTAIDGRSSMEPIEPS
jgi:hypothetical protein